MKKKEFLESLRFPQEWLSLGLYPDSLFRVQLAEYEPQHISSSEHTRNGAFTWWLHQAPSVEILKKLALVSLVEPDIPLRIDVQQRIREAERFNEDVDLILQRQSGR